MLTSIREMEAADIPAVLAVARSLHGQQGWFDETGLENIAIDLGFHRVWVAVSDGRIVGFLMGFTYEGIGHLGWMGVERGLHRQGIGRKLMERFESAMRAAGIKELEVFTLGDSVDYPPYVPTRAFYRAMGFKDYRREKRDTWACPEALYLRKKLAPETPRMLAHDTLERIEQFWAAHFGCSVAELRGPGSRVLLRADKHMAWLFRYRDACIWHVPQQCASAVTATLAQNHSMEQLLTEEMIRRTFGSSLTRLLGPCPIGYCDAQTLRTDASLPACRQLATADAAEVQRLADLCGREAWEHGGVDLAAHRATFGCFHNGHLVSAASYEIWGATVAHVGVVTAPEHRDHGFGRSVATATTAHALGQGLVPQWRTLATNVASLKVGQAIGYVPTASHFFIGLSLS